MAGRFKTTLRRLGNSLVLRLIALGIVLVAVGMVFRTQILMPRLQKDVSELVAAQQLSVANYAAQDIDGKIVARRDLIRNLALDLNADTLAAPSRLEAWLKEKQDLYPLFNSGLLVVRADGTRLITDYPAIPTRQRLDYRKSDWFVAAMNSREAVIGRPTIGRATGDPLIIMAMAVRDSGGKPLAVLAGVSLLNAPGFLDLINGIKVGNSGGFLLVSPQDKLFVTASDPDMVLKPTPPTGVNLLHDKAMAGYRGVGVTVNAKGVEELSAMVSVPSTGWFLVARIPTAEAFRPVREQGKNIIYNSVLTTAIVVVALLLILPWVFRPLTDAARQMRLMASGEVAPHPLEVARHDEVGELILGFNSLLKKLTDREDALRKSETRLAYLALHDPLTGLPNRAMLEDRLEQALVRAERQHTQVALLFCDLDGFKPVNDIHGHDTGDEVLRLVAERLLEGRRKSDTVCRLGGDEFIILLADLEDARAMAENTAKEYVTRIAQPFQVRDLSLTLGISIGIALFPSTAGKAGHLLTCADTAMYAAKQAGRGRYTIHGENA
ncbi:MAG: diguanylate cyclase [Rhodocyclaceae bacterium]|nr:MAG: diguanylate cyclase [Rhodocyclaceae bacterium]